MTAPQASYNLRRWASGIVNAGDTNNGYPGANLLVVGDSLSTPHGVSGRLTSGIKNAWKPYRWSGWFCPSSYIGYNVAPANMDGSWTMTPVLNNPVGLKYNHYDYSMSGTDAGGTFVIGDFHQAQQNATFDSATGSPVSPSSFDLFGVVTPNFAPNPYREAVFTGNVANNTIVLGFSHDYRSWDQFHSITQPHQTASKFGNWATDGDTIRGRLIYLRNPSGTTSLVWRSTRGGTLNNSTAFDASGALAIVGVDVDFTPASASSNANRLYAQLLTDNAGHDETGTVVPVLGARFWRPNSPGLEINHWTNSGWRSQLFRDTDIVSSVYLGQWLEQIGWPTHLMFFLGQNQGSTETTELNVGTSADYTLALTQNVNRILGCYDTAGRSRPRVLLISMFDLPQSTLTATGRTAINYATMDRRSYEIAVDNDWSFLSLYQSGLTPAETTDVTQSGTYAQSLFLTDDIHQTFAGSMYFAGSLWRALRDAVDGSSSSGRQWRVR